MSDPLLLIGAGGHVRSCIDVIEREGRFKIHGLVGHKSEQGQKVFGYPVIGADADIAAIIQDIPNVLIGLGQIKSPEGRIRLYHTVKENGGVLPVIKSPGAYLSEHASVGEGSILMHGSIVNAGSTLGVNCIINTRALVEHDVSIKDHCHISTKAVINGGVSIGEGTFLGSASKVRELVKIGSRCVIGMGASVFKDLDDGSTFI